MLDRIILNSEEQNSIVDFPNDLNGFKKIKALGGGTCSTYLIKHEATQQSFVLKFGAHPDAMKVEILVNHIYQVSGVLIPRFKVYKHIPEELAQELNLNNKNAIFQISEYILPTHQPDATKIQEVAKKDFIIHALVGNIDVAKQDNFIQSQANGLVYLVDAGANFIYRALGERRNEKMQELDEVSSLRDSSVNSSAFNWFKEVNNDVIAIQVNAISIKARKLEQIIWSVSKELDLSEDLRESFLQNFSYRYEKLVSEFCSQQPQFSKIDKLAVPGKTAAGILTYTYIPKVVDKKVEKAVEGAVKEEVENEAYVLLSQRTGHKWWANFGGGSKAKDGYLYESARREVAEESNHQLIYSRRELLNSPSHDIITIDEQQQKFTYRLYFTHHHYIETNQFIDPNPPKPPEHTAHQWIPVRVLLDAIDNPQKVVAEGIETIKISLPTASMILYPPLYEILKITSIKNKLERLVNNEQLLKTHTQSQNNPQEDYKNLQVLSPMHVRKQISDTLINHSHVLRELKRKQVIKKEPQTSIYRLSQSELHLKAILKNAYQDSLDENVKIMFDSMLINFKHTIATPKQKEYLINSFVTFIEREKTSDQLFLYHACDSQIAFAYDVYSALYQILGVQDNTVFRASNLPFKQFPNILSFIDYYSKNGSKELHNNKSGFQECALSTNVPLFGNHETDTSCSVHYLLNNQTRRPIEFKKILNELFKPFSVTDYEIDQLYKLYEEYCVNLGGALYQISINPAEVNDIIYPAQTAGKMYKYKGKKDLIVILDDLRNDLESNYERHPSYIFAASYITNLQARLFVPPTRELKTYKITYQQPIEENIEIYQNKLTELVVNISHTILSNANVLNMDMLGRHITLFKILPSVSEKNQLPLQPVTEDYLAKSIINNNEAIIDQIFVKFPEMKHNKIKLPIDLFKANTKSKDKKMLPLVMMLLHADLSSEFITKHYGENCLQNIDLSKFTQTNHLLIKLLKKIKPALRFDIAKKYFQSNTLEDLLQVANLLDENDFVPFLINNKKLIQDELDNKNIRFIINKYITAKFLNVIEQFVKINDFEQLHTISKIIPKEFIYKFYIAHLDKPYYKIHLDYLLIELDYDDKRNFAKQFVRNNKDGFTFISDYSSLVDKSNLLHIYLNINQIDCYKFISSHLNLIDKSILISIIQKLSSEEKIKLLEVKKDLLDKTNIHVILAMFNLDERLDFATNHKALLNQIGVKWDDKVLKFVQQYKKMPLSDFPTVLQSIPKHYRYAFAEFHMMIDDFPIQTVMELLPDKQKMVFLIEYYQNKKATMTLPDILSQTAPEYRYRLTKNVKIIKYDIEEILSHLAENEQRSLLRDYYKNEYDIDIDLTDKSKPIIQNYIYPLIYSYDVPNLPKKQKPEVFMEGFCAAIHDDIFNNNDWDCFNTKTVHLLEEKDNQKKVSDTAYQLLKIIKSAKANKFANSEATLTQIYQLFINKNIITKEGKLAKKEKYFSFFELEWKSSTKNIYSKWYDLLLKTASNIGMDANKLKVSTKEPTYLKSLFR